MRWLSLAGILFLLLYPLLPLRAQRGSGAVGGRITDPSSAAIPGAAVTLRLKATGFERSTRTDRGGAFRFDGVTAGDYVLTVSAAGFTQAEQEIRMRPGESRDLDLELPLASLPQQVVVNGGQIIGSPEALQQIPGSVGIVTSAALTEARVFSSDEALRKVSGVFTRSEEGFGLRPNIGIRGLNPTRSTKVLLLEDGIPLTYAPYGDNATYYHPPIDRFDSVEVVKGAGQILYGPMTVGGVINYVTPPIPDRPSGFLTLTGGNRSYLNGHLQYGGTWGRTGWLLDASRKQGAGARENLRSGLNDITGKVLHTLTPRQTLSFKVNFLNEDSNVTYSGLTESEFRANPRGNPFLNDFFYGRRFGAAVIYTHSLTNDLVLTTNAYGSHFNRDWWRQSSNSGQRPNDSSDPACAGMANLSTTCGNEGRQRGYFLWGIEPRFRSHFQWGRLVNEADFGFRAHFEDQDRQQENGPLATSREGVLVENNKRKNQAYSGFLQNRFQMGRVTVTPGVRLERVRYERLNRLSGAAGTTKITEVIPGLGIAYSPQDTVTVFAGLHRGFAPPRTEDIISNSGGSIDLDPELSWNYEVGLRTSLGRHGTLEATYFRMDYENQIIPASVAGGVGATLTSAGETRHQGVEVGGRWDLPALLGSRHGFSLRAGYTWIPTAEFVGTRFSSIAGFQQVSVTGNRLPYAAEHLVNSGLLYSHSSGTTIFLEGAFTSRQFGDDLNTTDATPNGQRGIVPGNAVWNATLNVPLESYRSTLFLAVKNLFDRTYIVDRTRGILPGMPRQVQGGLRIRF